MVEKWHTKQTRDCSSINEISATVASNQENTIKLSYKDEHYVEFPSPAVECGMTWPEVYEVMKYEGWTNVKGTGLVNCYYLHPSCRGMRPADLRRDKVEGTDYFTSTDALREHAMKNRVCQSGPGVDGDPGGGESDRRNAAAVEGKAKQDEDNAGPENEEDDSLDNFLDNFSTEAEMVTENLTLPKSEVETTQLKSEEVHSPRDEKAVQQHETANGSEAVMVGNEKYYFKVIIHPETVSDHFIILSTRTRIEMITFKDIRECILEQLELDFESYQFVSEVGAVSHKQEHMFGVNEIFRTGEGTHRCPLRISIKESRTTSHLQG